MSRDAPTLFDMQPTREQVLNPDLAIKGKAPKEQHYALAGKRLAVLEALQRGPKTTIELVAVGGTGATKRVYELRRLGFAIDCDVQDSRLGIYLYTLKEGSS